jgi:regulator of nucleoside diphosphate kinase
MQPLISEADYNELGQIIVTKQDGETKLLKNILKKFRIVKEVELPSKIIRLNSVVVLWNDLLKRIVRLRIVLPDKEDLKARKVSVLAPISMALLGRKENDDLIVHVPGVEKQLRVIKVTNE